MVDLLVEQRVSAYLVASERRHAPGVRRDK